MQSSCLLHRAVKLLVGQYQVQQVAFACFLMMHFIPLLPPQDHYFCAEVSRAACWFISLSVIGGIVCWCTQAAMVCQVGLSGLLRELAGLAACGLQPACSVQWCVYVDENV